MISLDKLSSAEYAKQLRDPEGDVGIAVARHISAFNRTAHETTIRGLDLKAGCSVLEIGFGDGQAAPIVTGQADDVRYTGIDSSRTMVEEACQANAPLLIDGRASFVLASSTDLPFPERTFDYAFSIGVIHFWPDPTADLRSLSTS